MRLERAIFENDGTLDKYMGDGLMATFGTPRSGPDDASRAIAAARTIIEDQDRWNTEFAIAGLDPVRISVGVQYEPVVSGDIGSERCLEFASIGDAVNLAARLEQVTRLLGAAIVISEVTADRARRKFRQSRGSAGGLRQRRRGRHSRPFRRAGAPAFAGLND